MLGRRAQDYRNAPYFSMAVYVLCLSFPVCAAVPSHEPVFLFLSQSNLVGYVVVAVV